MAEDKFLFAYDMQNGMTYVGKRSPKIPLLGTKRPNREGSVTLEDVCILSTAGPLINPSSIRAHYHGTKREYIPQVTLNLERAIAEYIVEAPK